VEDFTQTDASHIKRVMPLTIDTYQQALPGMQAEAARIFEKLIAGDR
jgi:hypothetical protein